MPLNRSATHNACAVPITDAASVIFEPERGIKGWIAAVILICADFNCFVPRKYVRHNFWPLRSTAEKNSNCFELQ